MGFINLKKYEGRRTIQRMDTLGGEMRIRAKVSHLIGPSIRSILCLFSKQFFQVLVARHLTTSIGQNITIQRNGSFKLQFPKGIKLVQLSPNTFRCKFEH